ncbi:MAG: thioredoxin domain-containing protein [Phycisphaerae bacterium]|nr:thioredoxin domain-containing protein [Phycisphaerae bacterium]
MRSSSLRRLMWCAGLAICAVGTGVSWYLSENHVRQGFGEDTLLGRVCEDGTASCDEVIRSDWGTVLGVPTAVWGLVYFAGLGLWLLLTGLPNRGGRAWHALLIVGTGVGLGIAVALAYNMFATLPAWCPLCSAVHVCSLLIFLASVLLWPRRAAQAAAEPVSAPVAVSPSAGRVGLAGVAIAFAAVALHQNFQHRRYRAETAEALRLYDEAAIAPTSAPAGACGQVELELAECREHLKPFMDDWQSLVQEVGRQEIQTLALRQDDPVVGPSDARNVLVVFSDFECPRCMEFASYWRREIEPYAKDRVRFVWRHFPMNTDCNPLISKTLYARACESAAAAEAARMQGGNDAFWKMHDKLLINARVRERKSYAELAGQIGLDPEQLVKDMKDPRVRDRIQQDLSFGQQAGVTGTPTLFLNGRRITVWGRDRLWQHYLQFRKPTSTGEATSEPAEAP